MKCKLRHVFKDVGGSAADFGYMSGKYGMDLIIGDAVVENPFLWTLVRIFNSGFNFIHTLSRNVQKLFWHMAAISSDI